MFKKLYYLLVAVSVGCATAMPVAAQTAPAVQTAPAAPTAPSEEMKESQVEIYRIAPGQHENFLRFIALCDEANRQAGLPPRQLYVHQDGASWDYLLIQPSHVTKEQGKAVYDAMTRLGLPHGANFSLEIRKFILEHTDTATDGPTSAAEWLRTVKK